MIGCLLMTLGACSQKHDHKGKTPLVEVGGKFLYQEDLQTALPLNLVADDSILFAESYIRNWIEDALLFEKAEDNVRDSEKVKSLVESYRKALVMHAYQEELIKQQEEILKAWAEFEGKPQQLGLPSAPAQFITYFEEDNRPQTKSERELEGGMAVSIGRLREDSQYDYKFVCLAHNTLRGAAGGAVLLAELLCAEGYMD